MPLMTNTNVEDRIRALATHLACDPNDVAGLYSGPYGEGVILDAPGEEWAVLTDAEADQAWDEDLDSYIDDCLELPPLLANYFDREAWKRDARVDGRGHSLSGYDGCEWDITDPQTGANFVAFRTN